MISEFSLRCLAIKSYFLFIVVISFLLDSEDISVDICFNFISSSINILLNAVIFTTVVAFHLCINLFAIISRQDSSITVGFPTSHILAYSFENRQRRLSPQYGLEQKCVIKLVKKNSYYHTTASNNFKHLEE